MQTSIKGLEVREVCPGGRTVPVAAGPPPDASSDPAAEPVPESPALSTVSIGSRTSPALPGTPAPIDERSRIHPSSAAQRILHLGSTVGKVVTYSATALVAGSTAAYGIDALVGVNTFRFFLEHPLLSGITATAHSLVMFLSVSAGVGLSKFRREQGELKEATERCHLAFVSHRSSLEKIDLKVHPLLEWVEDLGHRTRKLLPALSSLPVTESSSEESQINPQRLSEEIMGVCSALKTLRSTELERTLNGPLAIKRVTRQVRLLPERIEGLVKHFELFDTGKPTFGEIDSDFHSVIDRARLLVESIQAPASDSVRRDSNLRICLDLKELSVDLRALEALAATYRREHANLHAILPKIASLEFQIALYDLADGLESLRGALVDERNGELRDFGDTSQRSAFMGEFQELRALAIQLHARTDEFHLDSKQKSRLALALERVNAISEETPVSTLAALVHEAEQNIRGVYDELRAGELREDTFAKFKIRLMKQIEDFSERYPRLAVQASFASFAAAITYWVSCSAVLDALIPTGGNLYDDLHVAAEHRKYMFPFAFNTSLIFLARTMSYKFRPYLVWASLELSELTFIAVKPFAWLWDKGEALFSRGVDRLEGEVVRKKAHREN